MFDVFYVTLLLFVSSSSFHLLCGTFHAALSASLLKETLKLSGNILLKIKVKYVAVLCCCDVFRSTTL